MADGVDGGVHIPVIRPEPDRAPPVMVTGEHLQLQPVAAGFECRPRSDLQLLSGMDERIPAFAVQPRQQQTLDGAAARRAAAEQPRRHHARVVDDEHVARLQQRVQIRNAMVRALPGGAVEPEQARRVPDRRRFLGDKLGWKLVVEVRQAHGRSGRAVNSPSAAVRRPR